LKDAIFKRKEKGKYGVIARSSEAELHVDPQRNKLTINMRHGYILAAAAADSVQFDNQLFEVDLPPINQEYKPSPRAMTWQQLLEARAKVSEGMVDIAAQLATVFSHKSLVQPPTDLAQQEQYLQNVLRAERAKFNGINAELQMRPALSAGCLFF